MKKQILSLIIILNLFTLSAKTISREYTTDKETGDAVVIETYEGDENGLIERRLQGNTLPVARIIKDIYSSDNKYNFTYTITYNINLATGFFDKKEFFYNENSLMEYSVKRKVMNILLSLFQISSRIILKIWKRLWRHSL